MATPQVGERETLHGHIDRVTFHAEDTGYTVLRVEARGHREPVTLVGSFPRLAPGESIEAVGVWATHAQFGLQFKAEELRTIAPSTLEGIERYLGSGLVKGVGPHFAKKLVAAFGEDVFEVIEKEPERLKKIKGIGGARLEKILKSWDEQRAVRAIILFLQNHGVPPSRALRIYRTYGSRAIERITENPYSLARDIPGFGFRSADKLALRLGVAMDSLARIRAGVQHVLSEKIGEGHCAYPEAEVGFLAAELLESTTALARAAIEEEVTEYYLIREIIREVPCLFPPATRQMEESIAERIALLNTSQVPWKSIDAEASLQWVNSKLSIELEGKQAEAVKLALESKVFVVTGGPGTGKTTLTKAVVEILASKQVKIALCSPTGRAAKRLAECTGREAKTIHRLLGFERIGGGFQHGLQNPLDVDFLLVDEASMIDVYLMNSLLKALPPEAALVLVGDIDQLPSVGPGSVLQSLIESGCIPVVRLDVVFRQARESQIVANAHRIRLGEFPQFDPMKLGADFFFLNAATPDQAVNLIVDLVRDRLPKKYSLDAKRDIQVLCPMNRGGLGSLAIGNSLQKALNPNPPASVEKFGHTFAVGDKVMATFNDYDKEVFNGDIGYITSLDCEEGTLDIDFDGRSVRFDYGELDALMLAYATSVHKAQGSEFPAVVIPIHPQHHVMLKRNLLYTAITRGKRIVVLVGTKPAIETALRAAGDTRRWTGLTGRLQATHSTSVLSK